MDYVSKFTALKDAVGFIADSVVVLTLIGGTGTAVIKGWKKWTAVSIAKKFPNLSTYIRKRVGSKHNFRADLLKGCRIAIIDDEPQSFPVDYLRRLGLTVEIRKSVSLLDADKFKDFDVVLLDIAGVVKEDLARGGIEFLKRLKQTSPTTPVIAVSSQLFDAEANKFFSLADDLMNKPTSEMDCEERIASILFEKKSPHHQAEQIDTLLDESELDHKQHGIAIAAFILGLEGKLSVDKIKNTINARLQIETGAEILRCYAVLALLINKNDAVRTS